MLYSTSQRTLDARPLHYLELFRGQWCSALLSPGLFASGCRGHDHKVQEGKHHLVTARERILRPKPWQFLMACKLACRMADSIYEYFVPNLARLDHA